MSELTNIHARAVKDLTTPTELPVDHDALEQVKLVAGNFPTEYAGNEALTVKQIKDLATVDLESKKANKTDVEVALSNLSTTANKFYPTLSEANSHLATMSVNAVVTIGEEANKGLWYKATAEATTLTKSAYDPLTQANNYTNNKAITTKTEAVTTANNYTNLVFDAVPEVIAPYVAQAEAAATAATISAGVFETPEAGVDPVTGVADGAYFNVRSPSSDSYIDEYQNIGGSAVATGKSYPSSNAKWDASLVVDASGETQQEINDFGGAKWYAKVGGYELGATVKLANGDIVKSTEPYNTNNPNVDMSNWVLNNSAAQIKFSDSTSAQALYDAYKLKDYAFVTPEMHGAKANDPSFDNTTALNNAFLTGKSIYSTPDKTYYVDGILNSKGQELIGGWKIHTSRFNLGTVATYVTQPNTTVIKMLYLETAYDLSELLFIKQLGFNIVNHYGYFSAVPADVNGTFGLLLDNAKTAGLMVNMGTENFQAQHDLSEFIHYYKDHPAVFGFSVSDEPGARGFSIETQQNKINAIRAITGKHLSFVDNTGGDDPFNQKTNYDVDILFVDWYSHTQTGTLAERIEKDLQDMRYEYGFFKASSKLDRLVPVVGAFTYNNALAPAGAYFASDIDQVIGAADVFGRVGKGNFAMFPWDAASDPANILCVRNSPEFQWLAKRLCAQDVRKEYVTDAYLFGHSNFDRDWGIDSLLKEVAVLDKSTTDTNLNGNAYPVVLSYGETNTDRKSPDINPATFYSGIGFKGASAGLVTNIKAHKHVTAYLNHFNVAVVLGGVITIYETTDNGYTSNIIYSAGVGADETFRVNVKPTSEYNTLLFHFGWPTDTSTHYRRFLRGLVVTTDW